MKIEEPETGRYWIFPCEKWFDKKQGDMRVERDLYPIRSNNSKVPPKPISKSNRNYH